MGRLAPIDDQRQRIAPPRLRIDITGHRTHIGQAAGLDPAIAGHRMLAQARAHRAIHAHYRQRQTQHIGKRAGGRMGEQFCQTGRRHPGMTRQTGTVIEHQTRQGQALQT